MKDLSPAAFVIALFVFLLSIAYTRLPLEKKLCHWVWISCFAVFFAAFIVAFALWHHFKIQTAYLLVLELPWIHGLSTEVYTLWQLSKFFSSALHERPGFNTVALVSSVAGLAFVILQLYSLHAADRLPNTFKALAFGNAIFHAAAAVALGHFLYRGKLPKSRDLQLITAVFAGTTIIDIPIIVLFFCFPNKPRYCLTRCIQECIVISLLLLPLWDRYRNRQHQMSCITATDVERSLQTSIPLSRPAPRQHSSLVNIKNSSPMSFETATQVEQSFQRSPTSSRTASLHTPLVGIEKPSQMSCETATQVERSDRTRISSHSGNSSELYSEEDIENQDNSLRNLRIHLETTTTTYIEKYGLPTPPSTAGSAGTL